MLKAGGGGCSGIAPTASASAMHRVPILTDIGHYYQVIILTELYESGQFCLISFMSGY